MSDFAKQAMQKNEERLARQRAREEGAASADDSNTDAEGIPMDDESTNKRPLDAKAESDMNKRPRNI